MSVSQRWIGWAGFFVFAVTPYAVAENCFTSTILKPTPFMGNNNEVFQLTDGSIWRVKYEYEYLYEYSPEVVVCPDTGKLIIKGKKLNIEKISGGASATSVGKRNVTKQRPTPEGSRVIESQIDGDFNGWEGSTIYKLLNGQVWQQLDAHYHYHYAYSPKVLVYPTNGGFKMHVEGDSDQDVSVRLLN